LISKRIPTAIVICKYLAFKGATTNNCNVQVLCFQRGPDINIKCVSTLLSKGPPTTTVMCKYYGVKGAQTSTLNV